MYPVPAAGLVLGFHGSDHAIAEDIFAGKYGLTPSSNQYDWLGNGRYFWENDADRALEFARDVKRVKNPTVIGAIVSLNNCLDLLTRHNLSLLAAAYSEYESLVKESGLPMQENKKGRGSDDLLLRYRDCAVMEQMHDSRRRNNLSSYDTVRAVFWEGPRLYPGAGFRSHNHIQICVRNSNCIKGYFRPLKRDPHFP